MHRNMPAALTAIFLASCAGAGDRLDAFEALAEGKIGKTVDRAVHVSTKVLCDWQTLAAYRRNFAGRERAWVALCAEALPPPTPSTPPRIDTDGP